MLDTIASSSRLPSNVYRESPMPRMWQRRPSGSRGLTISPEVISLPWVYKVLRNIIGNEYQRVARSTELFSRIGGLSGDSSYRMETADALDVRRALAGLRETDREILYMAYWEDLTRAEIASILGISTVTVRVRLLRARQTLKALLYNAVEDAHSEEVKDGRV